jgi:hypothetical protein
MHPALLRAYAAMLPRLEAEEDIRLVNALAAGSGSLRKHDLQSYLRGLERDARPRQPRRVASEAELAGMGIEVVRV